MPFYYSQARSLDDIQKRTMGMVSWNVNPAFQATYNASALVSQTIYAVAVPYRAGQVVTSLAWVVTTAGGGTAPTGIFHGIANATTMLAGSANLASSSAWTTTGLRSAALSAAYTIPSDGLYYHLLLQNGAFATTAMQLGRCTTTAVNQINAAGTHFWATAGTAQTALPADAAAVTLSSASTPLPFVSCST